MSFKGKVAVVTGAGSGIGEATALQLQKEGCKVALVGRTKEKLEKVLEKFDKDGGEGLVTSGDQSKQQDMDKIYQEVRDKWGKIDYVVVNAGVNGKWAPLEELTLEDYDKVYNINVKGTFVVIQRAVPHMNKGGSIVVVSSVNGTRTFGNTGATIYASSKAAQVAMAKMLAVELSFRYQIRVNVVCPGQIDTDIEEASEKVHLDHLRPHIMFPQGDNPLTRQKGGSSDQVADTITFLLSDKAKHVNGTEMWIDGGASLIF
eukprot:TRINITY_DN15250_c0_g1_i1.p1 TRINITY_DN15250_c0_g1~~TRINITY_DN15250_c0_g1_i1.p1  ORF type:complete len:260 (+),score=64.88 TRINITY_DN15250_c0_g1_i1:59-838(+)